MSLPVITIENAVADAAESLVEVSDSARLDAEALLAWILDVPRSYLFTHPEAALGEEPARDFSDAISRRQQGEPVAYITGAKEFWSLQLKVSSDTLVPRPETETLVEQALLLIPPDHRCRLLDLGTGSGAIAIAIASERPKCEIVATDSSSEALDVAKENAAQYALHNIQFVHGDWTEPVRDQTFDIVASNPPYVRDNDPALDALRFEPQSALAAGFDGMDAIRRIAEDARAIIAADGTLLLEHGADQRDAVNRTLQAFAWTDMKCLQDLSGQPRVTTARMGKTSRKDHP